MSNQNPFLQSARQQSRIEAEEQFKKDTKSFVKVDSYRIPSKILGEWRFLVLPSKPELVTDENGEEVYKAKYPWATPFHSAFMTIALPDGGKTYATPARPDYAGIKGDLIALWNKMAKAQLEADNNASKLKELTDYRTSVSYNYEFPCYVIDTEKKEEERAILLFTPNYSQYKLINEANFMVWKGLQKSARKDAEKQGKKDGLSGAELEAFINNAELEVYSPMINPLGAYETVLERYKDGAKNKFKAMIDRDGDEFEMTEKIMNELMALPSIAESHYVYRRRDLEATCVFLAQKDIAFGVSVVNTPEFLAEKAKIESQLDDNDNSKFIAKSKDVEYSIEELLSIASGGALTFGDICEEADRIADMIASGEAEEEGDEAASLREMIQEFIEQEGLPVVLKASKSNDDLLDEIEKVLSKPSAEKETKKEADKPAKTERKKADEVATQDDEPEYEKPSKEAEPTSDAPVRRRRRA